jgi:hypothetical protein
MLRDMCAGALRKTPTKKLADVKSGTKRKVRDREKR